MFVAIGVVSIVVALFAAALNYIGKAALAEGRPEIVSDRTFVIYGKQGAK